MTQKLHCWQVLALLYTAVLALQVSNLCALVTEITAPLPARLPPLRI
ncbi:hypothetical protein [Nostoc sp. PA-18-2419]|nr:hypothetical protein [Nostoc sp. PA-18-2419]